MQRTLEQKMEGSLLRAQGATRLNYFGRGLCNVLDLLCLFRGVPRLRACKNPSCSAVYEPGRYSHFFTLCFGGSSVKIVRQGCKRPGIKSKLNSMKLNWLQNGRVRLTCTHHEFRRRSQTEPQGSDFARSAGPVGE